MTDPALRPPSADLPDESELAAQLGSQFVLRLSALIRTARTHDVTNQAFQRQLQDFMSLIGRALETESEVVLAVAADYLYLNGARIKAEASLLSVYHSLMGEFERRQLGGIRVREGVTAAEMERFFQIFMAAEDPALAERMQEIVEGASIENVIPIDALKIDAGEVARHLDEHRQPTSERGRAKKVFWRAVLGTKKILLRATQSGRPDLRHAKRLVQPVVDSIMNHEYSIVGLTALKEHDEYTYAHCVNVSILSISMGNVLGLPRQSLADLGVAGLMHDIGKISIPGEVLRKPAKLTPEEWEQMRRHPLEGMKMMIRMPGLSMLSIDSMRVCLEHHMNIDRTGYPNIDTPWSQSTMSRIVALADCFDAMTAHRAYHRRPYSAFEGLQHLLGPSRIQFDPAVLFALVRTVGLYPPGTVMLTDSGHMVLSLSPNPKDLRRPFCRVLVRPDGTLEPEETPVTWDPMPAEVQAVRVLRPEDQQVATQSLLAA